MIRKARLVLLTAISIYCLPVHADLLDVNISNDALAGTYLADMGQGFFVGLSGLYEEDNGQLISLDVLAKDELRSGEYDFSAGVGGKIFGIDAEGDAGDGASLALGGFAAYNLPDLKALSLRGEVYYGPSVTSTNDLNSVLFVNLGVEVEVIERAKIHVNYRQIRLSLDQGGSGDLDKGVNVGIKLEF